MPTPCVVAPNAVLQFACLGVHSFTGTGEDGIYLPRTAKGIDTQAFKGNQGIDRGDMSYKKLLGKWGSKDALKTYMTKRFINVEHATAEIDRLEAFYDGQWMSDCAKTGWDSGFFGLTQREPIKTVGKYQSLLFYHIDRLSMDKRKQQQVFFLPKDIDFVKKPHTKSGFLTWPQEFANILLTKECPFFDWCIYIESQWINMVRACI